VVPYLEMVTRSGLAEVVEGTMVRYETTAKGEEALRCMRELETCINELRFESFKIEKGRV